MSELQLKRVQQRSKAHENETIEGWGGFQKISNKLKNKIKNTEKKLHKKVSSMNNNKNILKPNNAALNTDVNNFSMQQQNGAGKQI